MRIAPTVNIRPYEEGDERRIVQLLSSQWPQFSANDALENWRWEYRRGPRPAIVTVAECDGKIVGHYAVLPMRMKYGPTTVWGAKAEGGVVHPDFRGVKGLQHLPGNEARTVYHLLISETLTRARGQGIQLVWGFPNPIALRGQVRAGYTAIAVPVSRFIVPLTISHSLRQIASEVGANRQPLRTYGPLARNWFRRLVQKEPPILQEEECDIEAVSTSSTGLDDFWEQYSRERSCITIARQREYLSWRMTGNPVLPHCILASRRDGDFTAMVSFAIARREGIVEGRIVDMLALEKYASDLRLLLRRAVRAFQSADARLVATWLARNANSTVYRESLSRLDFLQSSTREMIVLVKTYGLPENLAMDPDSWDLSMAFTEGVR